MKKLLSTLFCCLSAITFCASQDLAGATGMPTPTPGVVHVEEHPPIEKSGANTPVVVNVIPSPIQSTFMGDIAFDGEYLWVQGYDEFLIYQISPIDGIVIKSIPSTVQRPLGLAFDGSHLWLADSDNQIIQRIDTANGNVVQSFFTPADLTVSYPTGLAWDGNALWNNDPAGSWSSATEDTTLQFDTNGTLIETYEAKGEFASGLAFDGQFLWSAENIREELYKIDPATFSIVDTLDAPGGTFPNGLAVAGQFLWVANNDADSLYQIRIEASPKGIEDAELAEQLITLYPNPTADELTIVTEFNSRFEVAVLSEKGNIIQTWPSGTSVIDVCGLPSGTYLLQITLKNKALLKRFVKH